MGADDTGVVGGTAGEVGAVGGAVEAVGVVGDAAVAFGMSAVGAAGDSVVAVVVAVGSVEEVDAVDGIWVAIGAARSCTVTSACLTAASDPCGAVAVSLALEDSAPVSLVLGEV